MERAGAIGLSERPDFFASAVVPHKLSVNSCSACPIGQGTGSRCRDRGAYTGSIGYLNSDGDMDFNILIRTATLCGAELRFRAGAGIVADSDWERELAETRTKAQGMLRAFGARA